MPSIVSLDLETTGLDPQKDSIIEIGAVKFNGKRVEEEWIKLINPNQPIPGIVTQLTGISNEMVSKAPPLKAVLSELADFIGDAPILGQNVRFDVAFLQRQGLLRNNDVLDTYEMAAVLLPTASRYNLTSLCQTLGVIHERPHRAGPDARATYKIFTRLVELAMELPVDLVAEIVRQCENVEWDASSVFSDVLRSLSRQPISAKKVKGRDSGQFFNHPPVNFIKPLEPVDPPVALDVDEISALLEFGGPFSKYFEHFEHRPQQISMLQAVTKALSEGQHLMVEAGTGIGKSFAYLVPAALWAIKNNQRVVISTNTINLQDQLYQKDIPDLCAALGLDLRTSILKGRANYLCPRRFESLRQRGPENTDQMRVLAKILVWQLNSSSGDRNEINLNGPLEREVWNRLSAEDEGCKAEVCLSRTGGTCPFFLSRQAAQSAHILIVNHSLLLSDVATGSRVLPDYQYLIVDEAHHMEAATTSALSFRVTQPELDRLLRELGSTTIGILGHLYNLLPGLLRPSEMAAFQQSLRSTADLNFRLDHSFLEFFKSIEQFLLDQREGQSAGQYVQQERILPSTRTQPSWTEVEIAWDQTGELLKTLLDELAQITKNISALEETQNDDLEDIQGNLGNVIRHLSEVEINLSALVNKSDPNYVYWAEIQPNGSRLALQVAPLNIGPLMEKYLWHDKTSVILTSATLTTNEGFEYLRNRLNADEADELALGSPFDYETAALLYLANDIPEPSDVHKYQSALDQTLVRLAKATGGRMLALFTSYQQLKRTSQTISNPLAEAGITVYEQGEGASASTLLETFKESERGVLLGTRSFWEGVDIPGEALSVLAIVKLPFDVPSDPIVAARSETFEDPFNEYNLPEAILRFRQGFGRLIRTQSDRGVVAILDRRILTKRYGKAFIESIPPCKVQVGALGELPQIAARWLNL